MLKHTYFSNLGGKIIDAVPECLLIIISLIFKQNVITICILSLGRIVKWHKIESVTTYLFQLDCVCLEKFSILREIAFFITLYSAQCLTIFIEYVKKMHLSSK